MQKNILKAILILLGFFCFLPTAWAATSVSDEGVTWTFDGDYEIGQFVNGDYWVLDPGGGVNIVNIDPPPRDDYYQDALPSYDCSSANPESVAGYYQINGSMIDPGPEDGQAYDSRALGFREDKWIEAPGVANPLSLLGDSSLISSVSFTNYCQDGYPGPYGGAMDNALRPSLKEASILTVVSERPTTNMFRLAYSGEVKEKYYFENIDYTKLARLAPSASCPDISSYSENFRRVWIDHLGNWINEAIQPRDNMPQYGRVYSNMIGE